MIIDDLFEVSYGTSLELNHLKKTKNGINFVSRTEKNNGISAVVEPLKDISSLDAGLITVAVSGNILESFVQTRPFYTSYHVMILKPKKTMTLREKIFYCICIKANRWKYSYGRQANKTLKSIKLPNKIPAWVYSKELVQGIREKVTSDISKPMIGAKFEIK